MNTAYTSIYDYNELHLCDECEAEASEDDDFIVTHLYSGPTSHRCDNCCC